MTIKVGDLVTWRSAKNPNALGFSNCKVIELGKTEDGQDAARLQIFDEQPCALLSDLILE